MKPQLLDIIRADNTLGEGIQWDGETDTLWWTDIQARALHNYHFPSSRTAKFSTPERLCSFGFVKNRAEFIVAFERGFALYNPASNATTWLARPEAVGRGIRFNDGKVDRQGRFWAGTMVERGDPLAEAAGNLYSLDGEFSLNKQESGIGIANGLCWSPDAGRMYFADSARRIIYSYRFDPDSGTPGERAVFATTRPGAFPDGADVDCDGCVWSAHWGAGRVVRYTPDGKTDRALELPVSQPTCVTFGGPGLELLCITSAKEGLGAGREETHAGDVFIFRVGATGLPAGRYCARQLRSSFRADNATTSDSSAAVRKLP